MSLISNYISRHKTEILDDKNIESYVWRYIITHKIFTENHIMMDYLKEKYGIYPQLVYRYNKIVKKFGNIKKELQTRFKSVLDDLETINLVKRTTYTDKIYIVN